MAIVSLPADQTPANPTVCSICHTGLALSKASAGLFDADNRQALACVSHLSEVELLIRGWADFLAIERRRRQEKEISTLIYEDLTDA